MNGEEKLFFEKEFITLKTQFDERWKAHQEASSERASRYIEKFTEFAITLKELRDRVFRLPCKLNQEKYSNIVKELKSIKENDIMHLNRKINWLLFSVLGSVSAGIILLTINHLLKK